MEDTYKRITKAQFDLWMGDPVTQAYINSCTWFEESIREKIGNGDYRNPMSNDLTCNNTSHAHGMADAMANAANCEGMLNHFELLEVTEDSVEDNRASA